MKTQKLSQIKANKTPDIFDGRFEVADRMARPAVPFPICFHLIPNTFRFNLTLPAVTGSLLAPFPRIKRPRKTLMSEGYCVKCKAKKPISDGVEETMKNGRRAIKGKCPTCGTVMFKILGKSAATPTPAPATPTPNPNPSSQA